MKPKLQKWQSTFSQKLNPSCKFISYILNNIGKKNGGQKKTGNPKAKGYDSLKNLR